MSNLFSFPLKSKFKVWNPVAYKFQWEKFVYRLMFACVCIWPTFVCIRLSGSRFSYPSIQYDLIRVCHPDIIIKMDSISVFERCHLSIDYKYNSETQNKRLVRIAELQIYIPRWSTDSQQFIFPYLFRVKMSITNRVNMSSL